MFVRQYLGEQNADGTVWTEGAEASWEEFMDGRFCRDFQLFVRRVMEGSAGPSFREQKGPAMDQILEQLLEELLAGPKDRVLVTDEIGCGIVPADAFERLYRRRQGGSAAGLPGRRMKCGGCAAGQGYGLNNEEGRHGHYVAGYMEISRCGIVGGMCD